MAIKPVRALGMPWYLEEAYPRILEIMEDVDRLPRTYLRWRQIAEEGERDLQARGHIVIRAVIDPEEFPGWCRTRGLNVDAHGRRQFAAWVAMLQVKETH